MILCTSYRFVSLALVTALGLAIAEEYIEDTARFPGWKGQLPNPSIEQAADANGGHPAVAVTYGEPKQEVWNGRIEQLSWKPRVFRLHGFLSDEECEHLKKKASPHLTKSTVVDNETGKSVDSTVRTSTGTFFSRNEDAVISAIEKRISLVTMLPEEHGEGLQVLKYINGQQYQPHNDYFHDSVNARPENGGQRVATVLMYLSTPEDGGETVFPAAEGPHVDGPEWSDCAKQGLAVKPRKGDATLFYSMNADGETDPLSLHGSCPTLKGEKWSATKWIHVQPFGFTSTQQRIKWGDCLDGDVRCLEWAAAGECKNNAEYMLTNCRKSCAVCKPQNGGRTA